MRIGNTFIRGSVPRGHGQRAVQQARIAAQKQVKQGMSHQVIKKGMANTRAARDRYQQIAQRRYKINAGTVFDRVG